MYNFIDKCTPKIYLELATQFYFDARLVLSFHIDAFVEAELID